MFFKRLGGEMAVRPEGWVVAGAGPRQHPLMPEFCLRTGLEVWKAMGAPWSRPAVAVP